jgi:hypothetical protein
VGLQLITPHGADARALALAARVEHSTAPMTPRVSFDLLG